MTETVEKTKNGAILFDRQVIREIGEERFAASGWLHAEPVAGALRSAGRGNTLYVGNIPRQFVLRHYLRGGLIGKVVRDSYVWTGEDQTRPFLEWRMLAKMADSGLRVPRPAAARYSRRGPIYTADLITVRIPDVVPLSQYIACEALAVDFWHKLGAAVQDFHGKGVFHADMNAYNLQIDRDGDLWMLDFDRGRLRQPGPWQQKTLSRLHRSLQKIADLDPRLPFRQKNWAQFLEGYFEASRSA
jgi:3-deoxy-D-manno-octulosonic acid kinase